MEIWSALGVGVGGMVLYTWVVGVMERDVVYGIRKVGVHVNCVR